MTTPSYPPKPVPGDRVAVISPSAGLPELFPRPYELGLKRLREEYGLEPVEYPTTRKMGTTPRERADDIHAAFADPDIKAVFSSIGGDDQITVLPLLDPALLRADPKPFFGLSDNTNLLAFLYNAGVVGYHGGTVMTALGRPGAMNPMTADSLRAALFASRPYELRPVDRFNDIERDWADPTTFDAEPETRPGAGWIWVNPDRVVEGRSWGGCLEIVGRLLMADREVPRDLSVLDGGVLFLETSEELPSATEVFRTLRNMGERGLLQRFSALLMARPKTWSFERPNTPEEGARYAAEQREAVLRAMRVYAPDATIVFDVDFGHTDPQVVIPYGGVIRVDGPARRVTVTY
ncbi:LD-carboxypeptidase [Streptomyces ipomoeae]|uniref:LD-carboxypeptidase n=2 Tax=Streptomyces ipomoeae TaxID=103232 RepID=L1KQG6_9ACTN|nr:S66 peptidase family protein [Streptomyces ipomoeae]EKX62779.1 LD-carboxypeptidase [Streptomyces ipomoeae 91-03]MDX2692454.1 LD-carboxypeptidase [Streptomyces ipomoeae]MDX2838570.1 LD-carboxypeptidase [Streptomyces ipomoeae]TQE23093.1 LD-carboxypeptidase [Streptomyces ipomoeae]TQE32461.1 LD-carboxypeptidase [Streptomyces ipomoeae]